MLRNQAVVLILLALAAQYSGTSNLNNSNIPQNYTDVSVVELLNIHTNVTSNETVLEEKTPIFANQTTQVQEKKDSLAIFFILLIIVLAILLAHLLIKFKLNYVPESLSIVLLGAFVGFILSYSKWDWSEAEKLKPDVFFLVLLPPIIFESGYNLHKGNFFANIVPILIFSIIGTVIASAVMAIFLFILGKFGIIYYLGAINCFAFGSMISAVDPVITLAIFQALKVDVQLYMLAFGESMLNDAVAIVLATTAQELSSLKVEGMGSLEMLKFAFDRFLIMFFASAALGSAIGLISALVFKHVDLRRTPSLELALLLVFAYIPYGMAEAISLSGIMAILACAITMSQYTHFNISPITQITFQQTFRTISFVAETCTFAYLGLALFTIRLSFYPSFLITSIILLFVSRAANVFPLSFLVNKFLKVKISLKNQIIMWYSGMRGAVAFSLALAGYTDTAHETRKIILTSTLFIVLFTIIFMGGTALPLIKLLSRKFPEEQSSNNTRRKRRRFRRNLSVNGNKHIAGSSGSSGSTDAIERTRNRGKTSPVLMSKTQERVIFDSSEQFTEYEDDDGPQNQSMPSKKNILSAINESVIRPLFVRKFTQQEKREDNQALKHIAFAAMNTAAGGGGVGNGNNDSSEDEEEVFFQSSSTLNTTITSNGHRPLLPV